MRYPVLDTVATGKRIQELRKARNLRVSDISSFMGFESDNAVYKWLRGDSMPSVDNLYALSCLFETSIDNIIVGDREESECSLSFSTNPQEKNHQQFLASGDPLLP